MTKAQLIAAMGEPTETFGAPTPQIGWDASDFSVTAFFDDLGNTKQIQVSPPPSTPQERALFPCSLETKFR